MSIAKASFVHGVKDSEELEKAIRFKGLVSTTETYLEKIP